ncbi:MAG: MmgE/PrpD family protein [Actinomycetota bacterium]|nr:MmgE/PrpD family protein [Actinomycetota bacterium]
MTQTAKKRAEGGAGRLAEFVAGVECAGLPTEVVGRAKQLVSDALACGVAGHTIAPEIVAPIRHYVLGMGGAPEAVLLIGGERVPAPLAGLANGTTIHTIDYDDIHLPTVGHFGAPVVASALAAVERSGGSGADLVAAVVAGFEAGGKVGRSVMPGHYQRWHSTSSLGGIAAAAAAARGLGLDAERSQIAIGFAADDAGGTRYGTKVGDISKSLHAGSAAFKGLQGALLAEAGAKGPAGVLEHPVGFYWAYSEEGEPDRLAGELKSLGAAWEVMEVDIKAYPCIFAAHSAIEATVDIVRERSLRPEDIEGITVRYPHFSDQHGVNYEPDSVMAARLSIPFCIAVAAMDREVGLAQFENERFEDGETRAFMRQVLCESDRSLKERYPDMPAAEVTVETTSGERYHEEVVRPRGNHERPLSDAEHRRKLEELLGRTLDGPAAQDLLDHLSRIDQLGSLEGLVGSLGQRAAG